MGKKWRLALLAALLIFACPLAAAARPTGVSNTYGSSRDTYCADIVSDSFSTLSPSGRFKLWYVTDPLNDDALPDTTDAYDSTLAGSPDGVPDSMNVWAKYFDNAYDSLVTGLGYSPPVPDTQSGMAAMTDDTAGAGGDGRIDVYFTLHVQGPTGAPGFAQIQTELRNPDPGQPDSFAGFILINSDSLADYPAQDNANIAKHELFHLVQANYDGNDSTWLSEGTAQLLESGSGSDVSLDYLFAQEFPLLNEDPERRYETSLFFLFLTERFPAGNIIREIWERSRANHGGGDVATIDNVTAELQERGTTLNVAFRNFMIANAVIAGQYNNAQMWLQMMQDYAGYAPPFTIAAHVLAAGTGIADTTPAASKPGYLGYNLVSIAPAGQDSGTLTIAFDGNNQAGGGDDNADSWMVFALAMTDSAHFDTYLCGISAGDRSGSITVSNFGAAYDTVILGVCPVTPRAWTDSNIPYSYALSFVAGTTDSGDFSSANGSAGVVDTEDFKIMQQQVLLYWGQAPADARTDLHLDGRLDFEDIAEFARLYGL